jgi:TonB family protein
VIAQIEAHRFNPEAARARSEQGAIGISFNVGASARVSSTALIRSSGSAELDDTARQIVRSISPPPPGGFFRPARPLGFTSNEAVTAAPALAATVAFPAQAVNAFAGSHDAVLLQQGSTHPLPVAPRLLVSQER